MSLIDAPEYDEKGEKLKVRLLAGAGILFGLLLVLAFAGFISGHGWLFSNLYAEHRVNSFLTSIEQKDFSKAYGIYVNDSDWQAHLAKYKAYPLERFTEDWTTYSDVGPITAHHVDKSITDGSGPFGTGIIVASTINGKRLFLWYERKDGTLTYPTPHIFAY